MDQVFTAARNYVEDNYKTGATLTDPDALRFDYDQRLELSELIANYWKRTGEGVGEDKILWDLLVWRFFKKYGVRSIDNKIEKIGQYWRKYLKDEAKLRREYPNAFGRASPRRRKCRCKCKKRSTKPIIKGPRLEELQGIANANGVPIYKLRKDKKGYTKTPVKMSTLRTRLTIAGVPYPNKKSKKSDSGGRIFGGVIGDLTTARANARLEREREARETAAATRLQSAQRGLAQRLALRGMSAAEYRKEMSPEDMAPMALSRTKKRKTTSDRLFGLFNVG